MKAVATNMGRRACSPYARDTGKRTKVCPYL